MTSWKKWVSGTGETLAPLFCFCSCGQHERRVNDTMVDITPEKGQSAEGILSSAEIVFRGAEKVLKDRIRLLEAGGGPVDSAVKKELASYNETLGYFVKEGQKLEERRAKLKGVARDGAGYALDLGKARIEIGRRLACLRDASGTGRVSE